MREDVDEERFGVEPARVRALEAVRGVVAFALVFDKLIHNLVDGPRVDERAV
jgi:hypothetical protein